MAQGQDDAVLIEPLAPCSIGAVDTANGSQIVGIPLNVSQCNVHTPPLQKSRGANGNGSVLSVPRHDSFAPRFSRNMEPDALADLYFPRLHFGAQAPWQLSHLLREVNSRMSSQPNHVPPPFGIGLPPPRRAGTRRPTTPVELTVPAIVLPPWIDLLHVLSVL